MSANTALPLSVWNELDQQSVPIDYFAQLHAAAAHSEARNRRRERGVTAIRVLGHADTGKFCVRLRRAASRVHDGAKRKHLAGPAPPSDFFQQHLHAIDSHRGLIVSPILAEAA